MNLNSKQTSIGLLLKSRTNSPECSQRIHLSPTMVRTKIRPITKTCQEGLSALCGTFKCQTCAILHPYQHLFLSNKALSFIKRYKIVKQAMRYTMYLLTCKNRENDFRETKLTLTKRMHLHRIELSGKYECSANFQSGTYILGY